MTARLRQRVHLVAVLGNAISFSAATAGEHIVDALRERLSLANPEYQTAVKHRGIAWGIAPKLCAVSRDGDTVRIPRGAAQVLWDVCRDAGVQLDVDDRRTLPAARLDCKPVPVRPYQRRALEAFLARKQGGVLVLPAGAGKTRTCLACIAEVSTPTLVLVGAVELAAQWREQITAVLGIAPGIVAGGAEIAGAVTVATVQTLTRWEPDRLATFVDRFGMLVVDESHHTAADTFAGVVAAFSGVRLLGLTATPEREDGLGEVTEWYLGPVLARVTHAELIAEGHLVPPDVREVRTAFAFQYSGPDDWQPLLEALWRDAARNQRIVEATAEAVRDGHVAIVLTGRVKHAEMLAAELEAAGLAVAALTSSTKKKERARILDDARAGRLAVIVATSLADEGLDVPRLSCVVLAFPAKGAGRIEQRIGRIMRPHPDKRGALILDIVDARVGVLAHQARKRAQTFAAVLGVIVTVPA